MSKPELVEESLTKDLLKLSRNQLKLVKGLYNYSLQSKEAHEHYQCIFGDELINKLGNEKEETAFRIIFNYEKLYIIGDINNSVIAVLECCVMTA